MRFGRALLAAFLAGPSATAPLAAQLAASDITLSLDASGVKEVVALLERGDTSPAALDRVARLPTVRVVIAKAALYDRRATETSYEAGLKALIQRLPLAARAGNDVTFGLEGSKVPIWQLILRL